MGAKSKTIGFIVLLYSLVCFLINFNIWQPALIGSIHILWNPLSVLLTDKIIGGIPLIGGLLGGVLNYIFALSYSGFLGIVGLILLLH